MQAPRSLKNKFQADKEESIRDIKGNRPRPANLTQCRSLRDIQYGRDEYFEDLVYVKRNINEEQNPAGTDIEG